MAQEYPWIGEKTEKIQIRVTPAEKAAIKAICVSKGGITIGQYLLTLYRKDTNQL